MDTPRHPFVKLLEQRQFELQHTYEQMASALGLSRTKLLKLRTGETQPHELSRQAIENVAHYLDTAPINVQLVAGIVKLTDFDQTQPGQIAATINRAYELATKEADFLATIQVLTNNSELDLEQRYHVVRLYEQIHGLSLIKAATDFRAFAKEQAQGMGLTVEQQNELLGRLADGHGGVAVNR